MHHAAAHGARIDRMPSLRRLLWALAGLVTGGAGLATSYAAAMVLTVRKSPVVAVAEWVIALTPGVVVHWAIRVLGHLDKAALVVSILSALALAFVGLGLLARLRLWAAYVGFLALAGIGTLAVASRPGFSWLDLVSPAVGLATWLIALPILVAPLRGNPPETGERVDAETRRAFLLRAGLVAGTALAAGAVGRIAGAGRRTVEQSRRFLRLEGVTLPRRPGGVRAGLPGLTHWMTPESDFYLVHTAVSVPTIEPRDWTLRIHGMVEREVTLSYRDLVSRDLVQRWMTLSCVSNPVGGDLVGNAWWSGVLVRDLLAEVGVDAQADAVFQTSYDGWTCATPLDALTDDRHAMIAVAMNGHPLPMEHGFPARMIVPGLYGYVSATKWLVDLEVTRFDRVRAFWTEQGWNERGPVQVSSRIDVPRDGASVPAGPVRLGGMAWFQHTGVNGVQVSVDGGTWQDMDVARTPNLDTWAQWAGTVRLEPGEHALAVRALGADGEWQTGEVVESLPGAATGWHIVSVTAEE